MTDDKFDSLRQRVEARRLAASRKLQQTLGKSGSLAQSSAPPTADTPVDQVRLQAASAPFQGDVETVPIGAPTPYGDEPAVAAKRPDAPTGRWRCIVHSSVVSIDLIANIAADGSLSGQGTIIYVATNRIYQVSGQGDWTALPPDPSSPNWLFKFRLQPSNHAIFSWFATPTSSPNHMTNRFVVPNNGGVVETNCERIG
nr:hypothetical protein [Hyphomonas sp. Mor2]